MSEDTERIKRLEDRCTALEAVAQVLVDVISNPVLWGEAEGGALKAHPVQVRRKAFQKLLTELSNAPESMHLPAYRGLFVRLHNLLARRSA